MFYREIMAVCSEIHTKHTNTLCGQSVELLNVELGSKGLKWLNKERSHGLPVRKPIDINLMLSYLSLCATVISWSKLNIYQTASLLFQQNSYICPLKHTHIFFFKLKQRDVSVANSVPIVRQ